MPMKPIDMQVMMPKVHEIAKIHSDEQNRNQGINQQHAENVSKESKAGTETVHYQENAQKALIREKQQRERQQRNREKESEKKDRKKSDNKETAKKRTTIDIRV